MNKVSVSLGVLFGVIVLVAGIFAIGRHGLSSASIVNSYLHGSAPITSMLVIEVNGSHSPTPVIIGTPVNITWTSSNVKLCNTGTSLAYPNSWGSNQNLATNGSKTVTPTVVSQMIFKIQCTTTSPIPTAIQDSVTLTVTPIPSIAITSPKGGEKWLQGQTYNITWTSTGVPITGSNVSIALINSTSGKQYGVATTIGNPGSYAWKIPATINYDSTLGSQFKISATYQPSYTAYTGTSANYFSIIAPVCNTNSNCGTNGSVGGDFCKNGNIYQNYKTWVCNNPGTANATCSAVTIAQIQQTCGINQTCSNGSCANVPVVCNTNSDCGTNGLVGAPFCQLNSVDQNYNTYTCTNPGTANAACISSTSAQIEQTCGGNQTCSHGSCASSVSTATLAVSENTAYANQTVAPNTAGVKIGSFLVQNQSTSDSARLNSLVIGLAGTESLTNISALRTSDTTGSGSVLIQPTANNTFLVSDTLAPGATETIDVFANDSTQTGVNVVTSITVASTDLTSNVSSTSSTVNGQTIEFNNVTLQTPTLVVSSTTPSQDIADGSGGASNASQATFNFVANGGATIMELKFNVGNNVAIDNVCVGNACAQPVNGVADLVGLNISVPNGGGGADVNVLISYTGVGASGLAPGTTASLTLNYVKYISGGTTASIAPSVTTPVMTLLGSVPIVSVPQVIPASGLMLGAQNQIGEATVSASSQGNIKVRQITFSIGFGGFSTNPTLVSPRIANGSTTIFGSSCIANTATVTCNLGNSYPTDYIIGAGQSQTFNLYSSNSGGVVLSGATGSIFSSLNSTGFIWDDTSTNGASGTGLTTSLIYGFPTNSYIVHQ